MPKSLLAGLFLLLAATSLPAQSAPIEQTLFPGRAFDPALPTPTSFLGYALGKHIATYDRMVPYFERLAALSPRVRMATHGESYEGRKLYNITITAPENHARIDQIRANLARLADPRTLSGSEADNIIRSTPIAIMLVFGTDGAETAGPEAAIQMAYQLAAATDARSQQILKDAVVIIVPAENPDANQRAVAWYNAFRVGREGTADSDAAEHQFPWGINSNNHYQIDPNRESVWNIIRESQAMVALYRSWHPQVYVDNHGEHAQYTGPWYVEPLHEVLTTKQREWHRKFGEAIQPEFTKRGYVYAPWEYGQFDPGYWDTYPNFSGAVAWTTETTGGGSRGLRVERRNGAPYTLADGIIGHMLASNTTIDLAAQNREQLLRDFLAYKQTAIEEGMRGPVKAYAISSANDPRSIAAVLGTMRRNGIEVQHTTRELRVTGARPYFESGGTARPAARAVTLPAGSYILSTAQPESRMLRVLMEPEAKMSEAYLAQIAKAQAAGNAGRIFYDITAWSIPHSYNLTAFELTEPVPATALAAVPEIAQPRGSATRPDARALVIGYGSNQALHAIGRLRRDSIKYQVATTAFTAEGRQFGSGALVITKQDNPGRDLAVLARSIASESGVDVLGVDAPISARLSPANTGRIAVVMDRPVSTQGYGHIWYTFERFYGIDFTALNFDRLAAVNLDKYDVLIFPDGNYGNVHKAVAADIAAKLKPWVEKGGTLIGVRGGSAWIAAEENGLTSTRVRRPAVQRLPAVAGAVMRATITDAGHPLVSGYTQSELPVFVWSALAFEPAATSEAPIRLADANRIKVSGFVFPESIAHVAGTPFVVRDRRAQGSVVLFLDDPNFRLFWDGTARLFMNAVLLGDR